MPLVLEFDFLICILVLFRLIKKNETLKFKKRSYGSKP